ncbi:MAG: tRNA dihydrouridine synthase DusB [Clostridia bacterium]|nr:tRNA dihydrouridine synthase DusB [Clostridia bacterium]
MIFLSDKPKLILAPMAGVTDKAFRELCVSYGADMTLSEMASSKALTFNDKKTAHLLSISEDERPCGIQIFGDDPETMAQGAKRAMEFSPDWIDINMGCPAPKVASNGGGSSLMKNPDLAARIVEAVSKAVKTQVTVKMRTGWDEESVNAPLLAKMCEQAGAKAITVHGRTKQQMYADPIDFETIARVKSSVSIPVIGNGNVKDVPSAMEMLEKTGCDALMIGRGALGRPWIFARIKSGLFENVSVPEPTIDERICVLKKHIEKICLYKGEEVGMREARKHAAWYIKGIRGAAKYRNTVSTLCHIDDLYSLCDEIIAKNSSIGSDDEELEKFGFNNLYL